MEIESAFSVYFAWIAVCISCGVASPILGLALFILGCGWLWLDKQLTGDKDNK